MQRFESFDVLIAHEKFDLNKSKAEKVDADLSSLRHAGTSFNSTVQGDNDGGCLTVA